MQKQWAFDGLRPLNEFRFEGTPGQGAQLVEAADGGNSSVLTGDAEDQVGRKLREYELLEALEFVFDPHRGLLAEAHSRRRLVRMCGIEMADPTASIRVGAQKFRLINEVSVYGHHPTRHGGGDRNGAAIVLQSEERLPGSHLVANLG